MAVVGEILSGDWSRVRISRKDIRIDERYRALIDGGDVPAVRFPLQRRSGLEEQRVNGHLLLKARLTRGRRGGKRGVCRSVGADGLWDGVIGVYTGGGGGEERLWRGGVGGRRRGEGEGGLLQ